MELEKRGTLQYSRDQFPPLPLISWDPMKKILLLAPELEELAEILRAAGLEVEVLEEGTDVDQALENLEDYEGVVLHPRPGDVRLATLVRRRARALTSRNQDRLRVGLSFNMKRGSGSDEEAEFDAPRTIDALENGLRSFGYEVVRMEADPTFPGALESLDPDFVFNIAEGFRGRSRESQVPAFLEFRGVPFAGSDSVAISITLDKVLAKKIVVAADLDTPLFQTFHTGREKPRKDMRYPLIVKPVAEGSSKGIMSKAVAQNEAELLEKVKECLQLYRQPVLCEEYIQGREFTVGLIGNGRPVVLPVLEVAFTKSAGEFPVYSYEIKQEVIDGARYLCPAPIDDELRRRLEKRAREIFQALELRDFARIDFRVAKDGTIHFLEVNPLPGLTPGYSDLCVIGAAAGLSHEELIGYILLAAMKRAGIPRKHLPKLEPLKNRVDALYAKQRDQEHSP